MPVRRAAPGGADDGARGNSYPAGALACLAQRRCGDELRGRRAQAEVAGEGGDGPPRRVAAPVPAPPTPANADGLIEVSLSVNGEKRVLKLPQLLKAKRFWLIRSGSMPSVKTWTGKGAIAVACCRAFTGES